MTHEDFGYMIEKERHSRFSLAKKPFKMAAVFISLLCFVLITISAYYFVSRGQDEYIETVKSPDYEIKVRNKDGGTKVKNIDKTIYDNIVGSKKENFSKKEINVIKIPNISNPQKVDNKAAATSPSAGKSEIENPASIIDVADADDAIMSDDDDIEMRKPYSRVQLAALKSKDSAYDYWLNLKREHPKLFVQLKYFIQRADLGKRGVFYRLQIGNFRNQIKAEEFCIQFIAKTRKSKSDCIIVE